MFTQLNKGSPLLSATIKTKKTLIFIIFTLQALAKFHSSQKVTAKTGIEQEDELLNESAAMETSLNMQILELENENKQIRHELERVTNERDRMLQENADMGRDKSGAEAERSKLRSELKELKFRETRMLQDYSELEEENITLQKQVSSLKCSQVEFEGAKHEIRRLTEEIDVLQSQVQDLANLKKIAETQMEEALQALQTEREAKYALKKELDSHINRESMFNISNLAYSIRGLDDSVGGSDLEDDMPLKRLEADMTDELKSPDVSKIDLFSEIHLNELKRYEKQLEQLEAEKTNLTTNLRDAQQNLDKSQNDLQNFLAKVSLLAAHVDSLHHLRKQIENEDQMKDLSKEKMVAEKLGDIVHQYASWFTLSAKEIDILKADLVEIQKGLSSNDAMNILRNEITNLKNKLLTSEQRSLDLHADVKTLSALSQNAGQSLNTARGSLVTLSDDLAQLYHLVCTYNGETPSRVLFDHKTEDLSLDGDSLSAIQAQLKSDILIQQPNVFEDLQGLGDAIEVKKYVDTIKDQIKHLKTAVEHAIELNKDKIPSNINGKFNSDLFVTYFYSRFI
jgi:protein bicaudal D